MRIIKIIHKTRFLDKTNEKFTIGFTLVEVVIALSVLLIIFLSLISVYNYFIRVSINNVPLVKASYLLEEGIESVKILRDTSWSSNIASLDEGSAYYLLYNGTTIEATTTPSLIDGIYERKMEIESVDRDANSDISSSGSDDPNTKKITISVSWWDSHATTTKALSTYITNLFGN